VKQNQQQRFCTDARNAEHAFCSGGKTNKKSSLFAICQSLKTKKKNKTQKQIFFFSPSPSPHLCSTFDRETILPTKEKCYLEDKTTETNLHDGSGGLEKRSLGVKGTKPREKTTKICVT
jgi:hypothetical protein